MIMPKQWKPADYTSVAPYLVTQNAQAIIDFLRATVDATQLRRFDRADGSISHAEVRIDDTVVMVGEPPEGSSSVPSHLHVYVPDVEQTYQRAIANGGESVQAPIRRDDPDTRCGVKDPGGNTWWFSTQGSDSPSPES